MKSADMHYKAGVDYVRRLSFAMQRHCPKGGEGKIPGIRSNLYVGWKWKTSCSEIFYQPFEEGEDNPKIPSD